MCGYHGSVPLKLALVGSAVESDMRKKQSDPNESLLRLGFLRVISLSLW